MPYGIILLYAQYNASFIVTFPDMNPFASRRLPSNVVFELKAEEDSTLTRLLLLWNKKRFFMVKYKYAQMYSAEIEPTTTVA